LWRNPVLAPPERAKQVLPTTNRVSESCYEKYPVVKTFGEVTTAAKKREM